MKNTWIPCDNLKENETPLADLAIEASDVGLMVIDSRERIKICNSAMANLAGRTQASIIERRLVDAFPEVSDHVLIGLVKKCLRRDRSYFLASMFNEPAFLRVRSSLIQITEEPVLRENIAIKPVNVDCERFCLIQVQDVTRASRREKILRRIAFETKQNAEALKRNESRLRSIFDSVSDALLILDDGGYVIEANASSSSTLRLDYSPVGLRIDEFISKDGAANWNDLKSIDPNPADKSSGNTILEGEVAPRSQPPFAVEFSISNFLSENQKRYSLVIRDVSRRKEAESKILKMTYFDSLTGLANRSLFEDRLNQAVKRTISKNDDKFALLVFHVDRLKLVNESFGHAAGDHVIQEIGGRLRGSIKAKDTVARIESDEFAVILEDYSDVRGLVAICERLSTTLHEPISLNDSEVYVSVPFGIAIYPYAGEDASTLLGNAITAMRKTKVNGIKNFIFYSPEMNRIAAKQLSVETNLRMALRNKQFELFYQPKIDMKSNQVIGAEALIRWAKPDGTYVPPGMFLPVAEETGFIVDISAWVLEEAIRRLGSWKEDPLLRSIHIGVNVAAKQFRDTALAEQIKSLLAQYDADPKSLDVEITEGTLVEDTQLCINILNELKALGVRVSLDDFGTGYSSLSYLRHFPLDTIKIDKSFVDDILKHSDALAIARTIIDLGKNLKRDVVAEGIESNEQSRELQRFGCHIGQGYFFGRPMPIDEFTVWLKDWTKSKRISEVA